MATPRESGDNILTAGLAAIHLASELGHDLAPRAYQLLQQQQQQGPQHHLHGAPARAGAVHNLYDEQQHQQHHEIEYTDDQDELGSSDNLSDDSSMEGGHVQHDQGMNREQLIEAVRPVLGHKAASRAGTINGIWARNSDLDDFGALLQQPKLLLQNLRVYQAGKKYRCSTVKDHLRLVLRMLRSVRAVKSLLGGKQAVRRLRKLFKKAKDSLTSEESVGQLAQFADEPEAAIPVHPAQHAAVAAADAGPAPAAPTIAPPRTAAAAGHDDPRFVGASGPAQQVRTDSYSDRLEGVGQSCNACHGMVSEMSSRLWYLLMTI